MAMEGPTPVSALIHAATMVTAGVYLLIRTSPLIEYSSTVLILCLWVGAITTIFSSLIGLFQQDIKKVIAYSTMSQLAQECISHSITLRHQTIYVEVVLNSLNKIIVTINSQITKAHNSFNLKKKKGYISFNLFNSPLILIVWLYYCIFNCVIMSVRWKIIIISKLVGISEAIRLILIFVKLNIFNITEKTSIFIENFFLLMFYWRFILLYNIIYYLNSGFVFVFIEDIYYYSDLTILPVNDGSGSGSGSGGAAAKKKTFQINTSKKANTGNGKSLSFNQWLAGLIDGDGYFILTKKGYSSCEITMDARDKNALYEIKHKYGGIIKQVSNASAFRYKLRHRKGLILLINDLNGHLRNPIRLLQMNKLCVKFNIELKYPGPLTFNNGWLSGFIDSDGSVYFNQASGQVFIGLTQKNRYLLEPLISIYGGRIEILSPKIEAFKYIIYRKCELLNLIDNYFNKYPLKTEKMKRINLIKQFYILRVYIKSQDITKFNEWVKYKDRWEKYKD